MEPKVASSAEPSTVSNPTSNNVVVSNHVPVQKELPSSNTTFRSLFPAIIRGELFTRAVIQLELTKQIPTTSRTQFRDNWGNVPADMSARLWADGEPAKLAALARHIEETGTWRSYLTAQEHQLFKAALDLGPIAWSHFLDGKIPLTVQVTELPSEDFPDTTPQVSSVTVDPICLAFRVRYMLWDSSIAVMGGEHSIADDVLAELNWDDAKASTAQRDFGEDDDYDDFSGRDNDTPEEVPSSICVEAEDEEEPDIRAHKDTIHNYNRMYHTFENDWDSVLRYKKLQESDRQVNIESEKASLERLASSAQFGAANLSLKHLLGVIESKRDDMSLTDVELRNLISDVRKNRSKWASEDRIGQEELYEAAEKVVLELRATTEHSTAFLNKVSKRDAPNYYQVIQNPMDLNTVMKKLKTLQYNSKKEFVDDLMLIWQNCLTYNSDPKHFLRAHAAVMRKKTLALTPLIPDIAVRSREEVEAEAQAEIQSEQNDQDDVEHRGKGTKGSKGVKRRRSDSMPPSDGDHESESGGLALEGTNSEDHVVKTEEGLVGETTIVSRTTSRQGTPSLEFSASTPLRPPREPTPAAEEVGSPDETQDGESETAETDQTGLGDLESVVWSKLFTKSRVDYLFRRHELFQKNGLQMDAPVELRRSANMGRFSELQYSSLRPVPDDRLIRGLIDEPFLIEYEVPSGVPAAPLAESDSQQPPSLTMLPKSRYLAYGKLNSKYNENLNEVQHIRRLCAKVNAVRELQQNVHSFAPFDLQQYPDIVDPEPDISSRMPQAEQLSKTAAMAAMRRSVAKISMHCGFESCQLSAVDALTEIAGDYMFKLGKMLQSTIEDPNLDASLQTAVSGTLKTMGISSLGGLSKYVATDVFKYGLKLRELKQSVSEVLKDLLRPSLERYKDEQFADNSDQFVLGQFSSDLGDDYFGFKEMGLDKELGVENVAIPFHLLQQRVADESVSGAVDKSSLVFDGTPSYPPVTADGLSGIVGLLKPFFENQLSAAGKELVEDEKLPGKVRPSRPRIPATGKITLKKRPKAMAFIRKVDVNNVARNSEITNGGKQPEDSNLFSSRHGSITQGNAPDDTSLLLNAQEGGPDPTDNGDIDLAMNAFESFGNI